jgi:hypothetical protein
MTKPTLPEAISWPAATQVWFDTWRTSQHTDSWTPEQWQFLFDTALVHAAVWGQGNFQMLGELRLRSEKMGLTFKPAREHKQRKETPLDAFNKRRAARKSAAKNKARAKMV